VRPVRRRGAADGQCDGRGEERGAERLLHGGGFQERWPPPRSRGRVKVVFPIRVTEGGFNRSYGRGAFRATCAPDSPPLVHFRGSSLGGAGGRNSNVEEPVFVST
jgi:hypothetical protein